MLALTACLPRPANESGGHSRVWAPFFEDTTEEVALHSVQKAPRKSRILDWKLLVVQGRDLV